MATLTLDAVSKVYPNGFQAAEAVTFEVPSGCMCVLLGPSGCGKSTTLRMVAGLESASSGAIRIDGVEVNNVHPKDRDIAMVFQSYALYSHLTVWDNIAFPLVMRGTAKAEIRKRVADVVAMLELGELTQRRPAQLSGGQRQRVALARAIVRQPKVFLFDEPLSNLDARMRHHTRSELRALHARLKVTSLYVTHDQEEAMSLADQVVVMAGGRVRQIDAPMNVFEAPADRFVAGFIGSPPMNFVEASLDEIRPGVFVPRAGPSGEPDSLLSANALCTKATSPDIRAKARVTAGFRPTSLELIDPAAARGPRASALAGDVEIVELLGEWMDVTIRTALGKFVARVPARRGLTPGSPVAVRVRPEAVHLFAPGADGRRLGMLTSLNESPFISASDCSIDAPVPASAEGVRHV